MPTENKQIDKHNNTPEQCMARVPQGFVCSGCGGKLEPIDTVDNAGTPTYWPGCLSCSMFCNGVSPQIYEISRWLVDDQGNNYYGFETSRKSNIKGWTSVVAQILHRAKEISGEKSQ